MTILTKATSFFYRKRVWLARYELRGQKKGAKKSSES